MKKIFIILISIAGYSYLPAQEILKGGNMEDESAWKITDVTQTETGFDTSTITFNYNADKPEGGQGGCLNIAGYGITRNFIYQKVSLTKGHTYLLKGLLKDASDTTNLISNYWVEVNLVKTEPKIDNFNGQTGTSIDFGAGNYDYQLGMHYWKSIGDIKYDRLTGYDGPIEKTLPFVWIHCGYDNTDSVITNPRDDIFVLNNSDSAKFTLLDTVSTTTWYVLIKVGAFMNSGATDPSYNWLIDELSLWDLSQPLVISKATSRTNKLEIYPNPVTNGVVNLKTNSSNQFTYKIYNTLGMLVQTGLAQRSINVKGLCKGLYVLHLESNSWMEQHKIIIK
jgi:hypothetical protein